MKMHKDNEKSSIINFKFLLACLPIALIVAAVTAVTAWRMSRGLFEERAQNANSLMEKISQNIGLVMDKYGESAEYNASLMSKRNPESLEEALEYLKTMSDFMEEGTGLFFIDQDGDCYTSDGVRFRWEDYSWLPDDEDHKFSVFSLPALGDSEEHMIFAAKLPNAVFAGKKEIEYLCLYLDIGIMDDIIETAGYGKDSMMMIIRSNGTYVYHQTKENSPSISYNFKKQLSLLEYMQGTSAEKALNDIENGIADCVYVRINNSKYFILYHKLNIDDWLAVLVLPERIVSSHSWNFMQIMLLGMLFNAIVFFASILGLILWALHQKKLQQRKVNLQLQRIAEAERHANAAKTNFLSSMSHDIRTPMNAIIGMTTLASKHLDDKDYIKDSLEKIRLAGNHLLMLINDIMDISKIESGKLTLNPNVLSLADCVTNLVNIVRPQIKSKGQDFEACVHGIKHEYLVADELRLNQVYVNLLTNAVKYTPEGGKIRLDIFEESLPEKPDYVKIIYVVEDNGIGMSPEYMEKMYHSFTRASDSRVNKIQGSGLGLAICKQMVDLMEGTILCESKLNEGTKFTVTLELPIAEGISDDRSLPNIRVLLADDDKSFLENASETLCELGLAPDCADSGKAAVAMVENSLAQGSKYQIVIVDWKMPDMDGIETARAIRKRTGDKEPTIILSSHDRTDIEDIAREAGVNGFIDKPFFKSTVYYELSKYFDGPPEESANEEYTAEDITGLHILVAEDNDLNWEITHDILDMYGITCVRAENGKDCVEKMFSSEDGEFDLILMDVQMPFMNGKEASRLLRGSDRKYVRDIPIIAMTADAFAEDIISCQEAGMNGHVPKPVDFKLLVKEILRVTKGVESPPRNL